MLEIGADVNNIKCTIGPTIAQKSYEVGSEFYERFLEHDNSYTKFFIDSSRQGHYMFDLPKFVEFRLNNAAINHIYNVNLDTCELEDKFFSYPQVLSQKRR